MVERRGAKEKLCTAAFALPEELRPTSDEEIFYLILAQKLQPCLGRNQKRQLLEGWKFAATTRK